jgi:hypothetical protein
MFASAMYRLSEEGSCRVHDNERCQYGVELIESADRNAQEVIALAGLR